MRGRYKSMSFNWTKISHFIFFIFFISTDAYAVPAYFNFQANIRKPDGSVLQESLVSFRFRYYDPSGTCLIYIEDFNNKSMVGSGGYISLQMGNGSRVYPIPATDLFQTFNNSSSNSFACLGGGPNYIPSSHADIRRVTVEFVYAGSGGPQLLTGIEVNNVPYSSYAMDAAALGGTAASLYTKFADFQTCTGGDFLTYDGSDFICAAPSSSGFSGSLAGDVTGTQSVTVVQRVAGKTSADISTSVDDTANATNIATASRIVKRDVSGNASFNTAQAVNFSGRHVLLYEGTNTNRVMLSAPSTFTSGDYILTLPQSAGLAGQVLSTDGAGNTSWVPASSGSVTNVSSANTDINVSMASPTPVLTLNAGANGGAGDANKIAKLDAGGRIPAAMLPTGTITSNTISGDVSGTFAASSVDKIKNVDVTYTSITTNNFLKYNGTAWVNAMLSSTDMPAFTGDVTTSAGTTATTITGLARTKLASGSNNHVLINNGSGVMSSEAQLAISRGGTGASTFTPEGLIMAGATGSSPLSSKTCSIGQFLFWNGTTWACASLSMLAPDSIMSKTVIVATDSNITLSGTQTIDGVPLVAGDRVLVKNQTTASQNGIYVVAAGAWSRASDMANMDNVFHLRVLAFGGNKSKGMEYIGTGVDGGSLGSTDIYFSAAGLQMNHYNMAYGIDALNANTSGNNNTAFGRDALKTNSTGSMNTAIGYNAGSAMTTGSNNVIIGGHTGSTIATSNNNIIISDGSGNERIKVDGSGNVGIGTSTVPLSTVASGQLVASGVGIYPYPISGGTNSSVHSGLVYTAPFSGNNGTSSQSMLGLISAPVLNNSGAGGVGQTALWGMASHPTLGSSGAGARLFMGSFSGSAHRGSSNDLSTVANNALYGLQMSTGHQGTLPSTAVSGQAISLLGQVQNSSGFITKAAGIFSSFDASTYAGSQTSATTDAYLFYGDRFNVGTAGGAAASVTNGYGLFLRGPIVNATGTLTNYYGSYIGAPTGAGTLTNKYAFVTEPSAGSVGIGTITPVGLLNLSGTYTNPVNDTYGSVGGAVNRSSILNMNPTLQYNDNQNRHTLGLNFVPTIINTSTTGTQSVYGVNVSLMRSELADTGPMSELDGLEVRVGHANNTVARTTNAVSAAWMVTQNNGGTINLQRGMYIGASNNNNSSTTNTYGIYADIQARNTSSIATAYGYYTRAVVSDTATIGTYYGTYLAAPTGTGTLTNKYALVSEQGAGFTGIGTITPSYKLHVVDTSNATVGYFSDGTASCSITPSSAGNVTCSSDVRLKKDIRTVADALALENILKLHTVTYEWKHKQDGRHTGYIAQEIEKVAPEMVVTGADGYKQVSYTGFIPWITGGIKELYKKFLEHDEVIAQQKREITTLKQENADMKSRLEKIEEKLSAK